MSTLIAEILLVVALISVDEITIIYTCRTNFPKEIMCFPDFPFDVELPSFPRHSDVLSYLHQYADRYNLHRFIQFNHSVESVAPVHCCSCLEDHPNNENGYALLHCGPHGDILEERACNELSEGVVKWTVDVVNLKTGERTSEVFDFVLLCSGYVIRLDVHVQCMSPHLSHCFPSCTSVTMVLK